MVDLTDAGSPFQQSIPNLAFYVPAVVVFTLAVFFCVRSQKFVGFKSDKRGV